MAGAERAVINSAKEFLDLRNSDDPDEYNRAAREEAPGEVWHDLISGYPDSRFWVEQNKTVPLEMLQALAANKDVRVRSMVAMKRSLDKRTQQLLARDEDSAVRMCVARNKRTSRDVLESMTDDPWEEIRKV